MKISQAARMADASRAAYFAYWLCLTLGLTAACIVLDLPWPRSWALAAGTLAGTGLGQLCAWGRYRLWAAMTIGATALFFVVIALSIGQAVLTSSEYGCLAGPPAALARDLLVWNEGWLGFMAYVPAGLSGYLLVTEYGSFASLWFPLTFWMLPILEPSRGLLRPWVLVASAASLLLLSLYTRERRRVAVWRGTGAVRVSPPSQVSAHRRSPLGPAHRAACFLGLGVLILGVTGWLAPHLWQRETSVAGDLAAPTTALAGGGSSPCCPSVAAVAPERTREYFSLLSFHGGEATGAAGRCVACGSAPTGFSGALSPGNAEVTPAVNAFEAATTQTASPPPVSSWVAPLPVPVPQSTARSEATPPPSPAVAASPESVLPAMQIRPAAPPPPSPVPSKAPAPRLEVALLGRALLFALLALLSYLGVRPLRRWVTLTHLRRPLWHQSPSEQISNGWQWILIALRDGGWEALPEERPRAFARRVAIVGVLDGATVLERARHGIQVTQTDVEAIGAAARAVHSEVLAPLGPSARLVSWFRWPLV